MNIMKNIQTKEKEQSNIYSLLFEKDEDSLNKDLDSKNNNEVNKNRKIFSDKISKKCNSLLSNIYDKINLINIKSEQINKINTKSLLKISNKYYRISTAKSNSSTKCFHNNNILTMNSTQSTNYYNSSKNFHKKYFNNNNNIINQKRAINSNIIKSKKLKNETNYRTIESYQNIKKYNQNNKNVNNSKRISSSIVNSKRSEDKLKNYASIDVEELYKTKDNKFLNIERFNDAFRIEMNNTLYKYKPEKHLKLLNDMQRDNISLRQNMENIKEKINKKIEDLCNKKQFKNNNIKVSKFANKKIINKNIISPRNLPNLVKFKSQNNFFPYGYKARLLYGNQTHSLEIAKNKEKKNKRKKLNVNNPLKLFNLKNEIMEKALKKLYISLDTKNILKYINDIKREKADKNVKIKEYRKDKYFPVLKEVKEYLKQIENEKMKNREIDKDKVEKKMIDIEHKILKGIHDNKRKIYEDII